MINKDRIVPVMKTDLLSLYSVILAAASVTLTKQNAKNALGEFAVTAAPQSGSLIASEPVKSLDIASGVSAVTIYFTPADDYAGFTLAGVATETAGVDVEVDGGLYLATLSSGTVTISKVGL